jgi:hypothetical protein
MPIDLIFLLLSVVEEGAGRRDDRNGFALAAQSGQSLGRPSTNATSQVKE